MFDTVYYLAELSLPSKSAYTIHVIQMCNAISKNQKDVNLLIPNQDIKYEEIKKEYSIEFDFKIFPIFKKMKILNFISRIIYAIKCYNKIKKKKTNYLVISRSVIASIFLAIFQVKNFLEIHHELKGFSKIFFQLTKFYFIEKNVKYILINSYLLNFFNLKKDKYFILDDAVNIDLFNHSFETKVIPKTCGYFGSLTKGKGIELIIEIAKKLPEIDFHIYGDLSISAFKDLDLKNHKNITFFDHLKYSKIPSTMNKYEILLMPYLNKVFVRSKNLEVSKYMSPLKLFEYLAASKIIIASRLDVYSHILVDNYNCLLSSSDKISEWVLNISNIFSDLKKYEYIRNGAKETAIKNTWDKRVKIIFASKFYN